MARPESSAREHSFAAKKPTIDRFLAASNQLRHTGIEFLKIDVETALTFSSVALQSNDDAAKRKRNRENARRGYDTILHLLKKVALDTEDAEFMSSRLRRLKSELERLGETF
jgi:hypothetical protein